MFIQRKQHLVDIERVRVAEGRDLEHGLRLDRNERVDIWPPQTLVEMFTAQPDYFLSVYPESTRLYRKLAAFHGVDESELLLTAGIDGGLKTLFEIMTEPGDLVGVVTPTYAMYHVYAKIFQARLLEVPYAPTRAFGFSQWKDLLASHPAICFLPNPNQLAELEEFAREALARDALLVIDEAYHLFGCDSAVPLVRKYPNVVVARTFSKGFGVPSIRLGYLISNVDNMRVLSKTRFAHESNALSNAVAEYLLDHYGLVEAYNHRVIEARGTIKKALGAIGIPAYGEAGNFLLLDLGSSERAQAFVDDLRRQAIYVKGPCAAPWRRHVTISLGPIEVMQRFVDASRAFCGLARGADAQ
jgi:histidinol-phosphate aminotransferase